MVEQLSVASGRSLATLLLFMAMAVAPAGASAQSAKTSVYTNLSLIDGTGAAMKPNMAVVVKGERIDAVLPAQEVTEAVTAAAEIIDGKGAYLLPGLIDTHGHLATSPNRGFAEALMRRDLYSGIVATRDMAGDVRALADLSRATWMKEIPAPDLFYAALMAGPGFFKDPRTIASAQGAIPGQVSWMQSITDTTDMPLAVSYARGTAASGIKIYANLPGTLVEKITSEAHRQGIKVWSHATIFPAKPAEVLDARVDVISHVCMLAYALVSDRPAGYHEVSRLPARIDVDDPVMSRLFEQMRRQGTILDATLWIYERTDKRLAADKKMQRPSHSCSLDTAARLTRAAHRQGVAIAAGTDGWTERDDLYPLLHRELELLADRAGIPELDVIRSATLVGAMTLGREKEMGSIEPGKLASFVIVANNPLQNIGNLRSVVMTVKRGTRYARENYRPIAADEWPEGENE